MRKKRTLSKKLVKLKRQWRLLVYGCVLVAVLGLLAFQYRSVWQGDLQIPNPQTNQSTKVTPTVTPTNTVQSTPTPTTTPEHTNSTWPVQLSYEQASSITVVVNKKHQLPADFVPEGGGLRIETQTALNNLIADAFAASYSLKLISGYRSYANQQSTYNYWVNLYGQTYADTISARAGHSEHQTGLAVDVGNGTCDLETCFGDSAAGQWVAANASSYGFIIRYPSGKESITGYQYEPWHLRYVGTSLAQELVDSGLTLDEHFNVPAGDY